MIEIEYDYGRFWFSHGKCPRGYGHYLWKVNGTELWTHGTVTECKKQVREYVKITEPGKDKCAIAVLMP